MGWSLTGVCLLVVGDFEGGCVINLAKFRREFRSSSGGGGGGGSFGRNRGEEMRRLYTVKTYFFSIRTKLILSFRKNKILFFRKH